MTADYFSDPAFPMDSPSGGTDAGEGDENGEKAVKLARKAVPIIILLAVLGIAWALFNTLPRDSTLQVSLLELDSGTPPQGIIADIEVQANGRTVRTATTGPDGTATVSRVPGNTDLTVKVTPVRPTYASFSRPARITNGQTSRIDVIVARQTSLELGDVTPPLTGVGQGCTNTYTAMVTNNGKSTVKAEIVLDSTAPTAPAAQSTPVEITPGASEPVPFTLSAPRSPDGRSGQRIDATLRVRYQASGKKLSLTLADTPSLDAGPSSFRCPDAGMCKFTVTLHNRGSSPLTNVKAEPQGELSTNVQIDDTVATTGRTLTADETYNFFVTINNPGGVTNGQLGKLVLTSSCPPNREIILFGPGSN